MGRQGQIGTHKKRGCLELITEYDKENHWVPTFYNNYDWNPMPARQIPRPNWRPTSISTPRQLPHRHSRRTILQYGPQQQKIIRLPRVQAHLRHNEIWNIRRHHGETNTWCYRGAQARECMWGKYIWEKLYHNEGLHHTILDHTHAEIHVGQEHNSARRKPLSTTPTNKQLHDYGGPNEEGFQRERIRRTEQITILHEIHNTLRHRKRRRNHHLRLILEGKPVK